MLRVSLAAAILFALANAAAAAEPVTFERHVRPILKAYCLDCHGAGQKMAGNLDLRLRRFIVAGGKNGPAVVPNDPARSHLVERMKAGEMPPVGKKVPADQIAVIEKWIASGAATGREEPTTLPPGLGITTEERAYWFYQPLTPPALPAVPATDRVRNPIDIFILANLKENGLGFRADADRATLIRRATFDLTGLPPTPQEIDAFVADPAADAYERLLDRLLASPAYGERWGRHWLDAVGYADSDGDGAVDTVRPYAWRYRDYVIRALNADTPLDRFVIEQVAGDELVPRPWANLKADQIDLLAATGFLRTAPDGTASGGGAAEAELATADTLKIVSSTLLGTSVGCAQCHDHRYDPVPQADYFQLRAVFEPALDPGQWRRPGQRLVSLYTDADRAKAAEVAAEANKLQAEVNQKQDAAVKAAFLAELEKFPADRRAVLQAAFEAPADKRTAEQKQLVATNPKLNVTPGVLYQYNAKAADEIKALVARVQQVQARRPVEEFVAVAAEVPGRVPATKLYHRGDSRQPVGPDLRPADLTIAGTESSRFEVPPAPSGATTTGRRLAWAKHITNGSHPLFGRVMANRIWLNHFGRGIVDTPGEFGKLGQRPTHPELLDWLALELPRQGWSLKRVHKLVMTSTVYRQASTRDPAADVIDRANTLYSHFPLRRLEAEAVRDRMLAATGRLDRALAGPPVAAVEDPGGQVGTPDDKPRRSVYLQARRSKPVAFLNAFDAPAAELNCERRNATTSAAQSLMLLNSEFVRKQAGSFALRVRAETTPDFARDLTAKVTAEFPRPEDAWSYGYGGFDPKAQRTTGFTVLPHFTGAAWQGGPSLPDPKLGYVLVTATGGHAGSDERHAAVRRWVAQRDGTVTISGKLRHNNAGDGVRGRIVSGRAGLLGEWLVKAKEEVTAVTALAVRAGDTIDFATDCRGDVTSDSFSWPVTVTLAAGGKGESWDSAGQFRGHAPPSVPQLVAKAWQLAYLRPATPDELRLGSAFLQGQTASLRGKAPDSEFAALVNLCQQLMASNEFLYVD